MASIPIGKNVGNHPILEYPGRKYTNWHCWSIHPTVEKFTFRLKMGEFLVDDLPMHSLESCGFQRQAGQPSVEGWLPSCRSCLA